MALLERDGVLATEHSQSFLAIAIVFRILASAFVGARFYCRRLTGLLLGMDDWLILAALVSRKTVRQVGAAEENSCFTTSKPPKNCIVNLIPSALSEQPSELIAPPSSIRCEAWLAHVDVGCRHLTFTI